MKASNYGLFFEGATSGETVNSILRFLVRFPKKLNLGLPTAKRMHPVCSSRKLTLEVKKSFRIVRGLSPSYSIWKKNLSERCKGDRV